MPQADSMPPSWPWRRSPPGATPTPPPPAEAVLDTLRRGARADSDAPAVIGNAERLSRGMLLSRALAIAHAIDAAVPSGAAVATLVPHSPAGLAAILGCLVAGRVCIPLNIADPAERQAALLAEAAPALLLAAPGSFRADGVPSLDPVTTPPAPPGWLPAIPDAEVPAMVFFTSGSSGRPKGIVVSHHGVQHRARHFVADAGLCANDRVLATTAPNIGSGFSFALGSLIAGAPLLVASLAGEGAGAVLRLAARERATVLVAGPAILRMLLAPPAADAAIAALRCVRVGAMALPTADVHTLRGRLPAGCAIGHTYASTEAMVVARWTIPLGAEGDAAMVAAGVPAPELDFALLDEDDRAVPDGAPGALVLRARHIALGEWQAGRLVPGRMPEDPARPGHRIFRTGDVMRLAPDGMLHFVARADRQVKIAGMRVEPAEIEALLRGVEQVDDAVVLVSTAGRLCAFVASTQAAAALHPRLAARLRAAMPHGLRPSHLVVLAALPQLPIGKPDLVALRAMADAN